MEFFKENRWHGFLLKVFRERVESSFVFSGDFEEPDWDWVSLIDVDLRVLGVRATIGDWGQFRILISLDDPHRRGAVNLTLALFNIRASRIPGRGAIPYTSCTVSSAKGYRALSLDVYLGVTLYDLRCRWRAMILVLLMQLSLHRLLSLTNSIKIYTPLLHALGLPSPSLIH